MNDLLDKKLKTPFAQPAGLPPRPSPAAQATLTDPRWAQVQARDAAADGTFVYSVATTGVYCRPSCPSRPANPKNVRFHAGPQAAQAAGFRPCRRREPEQPPLAVRRAQTIARLCHLIDQRIDHADDAPSLADLAEAAGLSPHHLHRLFKAATGVTPRAYAAARRANKVRDELGRGGTVTQALHGAGFNTGSRFYAQSNQRLGMTPTRFRNGGAQALIRFALGECSLGAILVAASEAGICAILLGDATEALLNDLQERFPKAELVGGDADFDAWVAQVVGLVEAPNIGLDLPLDIRGTAFQQRVWQALQAIPAGHTATYAQIAQQMGAPQAVRAVAGACAANALAVAIPCHRVVRSDGGLSGYRWGVERKRSLIAREQAGSGHRGHVGADGPFDEGPAR